VTVRFEGRDLRLCKGLSVAAGLLEAGVTHFRDASVTGSPRAPFCMMGVCFDCLLVIDSQPNQQSCMIEVREGMQIARQSGVAELLGEDSPGSGEAA
jgi:hypothetical protein